MVEEIIQLVTAYQVGRLGALVVVVPKFLCQKQGIKKGSKFLVKIDGVGRLIYERIEKRELPPGKQSPPKKEIPEEPLRLIRESGGGRV